VSRDDPKHGRWILPLIIVAMVVLTYTFVNSLEPAEQVESSDSTKVPPFPTEPTTTTTIPADLQDFIDTIEEFETQTVAFRDDVNLVNDQWEARDIEFNEAVGGFQQIGVEITAWEDEVAAAADPAVVPDGFGEQMVELLVEVEDLSPAVDDIVLGLREPDDGTMRREAVAAYEEETRDVLDILDAILEQAEPSSTTSTTEGETTSTSSDAPNA
jgi:hypothetical protein